MGTSIRGCGVLSAATDAPRSSAVVSAGGAMWRVAYADGTLSDTLNLSRAKDAAAHRHATALRNKHRGAPHE
jgi:hypothetical protein